MNKHLEELRKIDSDVFTNMGKTSQKTIDIVQETIEQLDRDYEEEPIQRDELGAINYEIDILLEVWSKELEYDIEILKRVDNIIAEWYKDVEKVHRKQVIELMTNFAKHYQAEQLLLHVVSHSKVFEAYGKPFTSGRDLWDWLNANCEIRLKT